MKPIEEPKLYGLLAEFADPDVLLHAAEKTFAAGYRKIDTYTPIPVHGLSEAIGNPQTKLPWITLAAGATGASVGFGMQTFASVYHYPLNVGGRPLFSWPAFIPITFETTILTAAFVTVISMLLLNGLPQLYHPVSNVEGFKAASSDKFFLCIEAVDPQFDLAQTREFLESLGADVVSEVAP